MNKKSFILLAAMALVLVGCNKEKEETIGTTASVEQQQQVLPNVTNVSNAAVPATIPVAAPAAPEQAIPNTSGQQQVVVQPPQGGVPVAPVVDQQNVSGGLPTMQAPVAPEPTIPTVATPSVIQSDAMPASPVVANEPVSAQNVVVPSAPVAPTAKPGMQHDVVGNAQPVAPVSGAMVNATDVVSTKASYRNIIVAKDAGQGASKSSNNSGSTSGAPTTAPDDED